jgi:hypothetical protein
MSQTLPAAPYNPRSVNTAGWSVIETANSVRNRLTTPANRRQSGQAAKAASPSPRFRRAKTIRSSSG